jgi:peptide-methionine (S)-S-oxide reductase
MALLLTLLPWAWAPATHTEASGVFAGGCFWGVESVFDHLQGVRSAVSGYADGGIEAVRVSYDPAQISYQELLQVFFTVAHDPTQRDRQGPDAGPEYRGVVYYLSPEQRQLVEGYLAGLNRAHRFARPIVTEVRPLGRFQVAEPFHQNYAARHPNEPYIIVNDAPKLDRLRRAFPRLYRKRRSVSE